MAPEHGCNSGMPRRPGITTPQLGFEVPSGGGSQTTVGTGLNHPVGVAVDAKGDVFIVDSGNNRVMEVPAGGGAQTTVGSGLDAPSGVGAYAPPPKFSADSPPDNATVGTHYSSYTFKATSHSGKPQATFAHASAGLPPGLTLTKKGVLSGTPTTPTTPTTPLPPVPTPSCRS